MTRAHDKRLSKYPHDGLVISQLMFGASFWGRTAADRAANFIGASADKTLLDLQDGPAVQLTDRIQYKVLLC